MPEYAYRVEIWVFEGKLAVFKSGILTNSSADVKAYIFGITQDLSRENTGLITIRDTNSGWVEIIDFGQVVMAASA